MKRNLFLLFMMVGAMASMAQTTILGTVKDSAAQPISYATISLLTTDSVLVTGTITDERGAYVLSAEQGKYILQASFVGYKTEYKSCEIKTSREDAKTQSNTTLDFFLQEVTEQLAEVEIKVKKPLVERKMDKLVLNVSESPLASGSNAKDLLKLAPGVNVDKDGNVTVNGKSVTVYIDNRPSYLSGDQLKAMLEGTDGNTIEKIEVISNPSAKYDAAGSGGIINIKTKRNMMKGLNGTLSASYGGMCFNDIEKYNQQDYVSLNLNYRTEKTYTFVNLTQVYGGMANQMFTETHSPVEGDTAIAMKTMNESLFDGNFQMYTLKIGNDWMIDKKNTVGFIFRAPVSISNYATRADKNESVILLGNDTIERGQTRTWAKGLSPQHFANLNYTHTFNDSLEQEITINLDYNRYLSNNRTGQESRIWRNEKSSLEGLNINTDQIVNIYSGKVDFETQFWKTGTIEAGVKYALSQTNNNMVTDSLRGNMSSRAVEAFECTELISTTPTAFNYAEHIAAAYVTVGKQFGEHWSTKLGLRGEYTHSVGDWLTADSVTRKSYFNLFPTAFVGYTSKPLGKLEQVISTSVSYTRRIDRPSYYMLNPFVNYWDAHSYQVGNTELTPTFDNDVELTFAYSQHLSVNAIFSHTQNIMSEKVIVMPNGDRKETWVNFGTCTTHGVNLSLTEVPIVPKFKTMDNQSTNPKSINRKMSGAWLTLTAYIGYYNLIHRSFEETVRRNNHFYANATLTGYLPKDWIVSLGCWYYGPHTSAYTYSYGMGAMNAGIRKRFPKQGLTLNLQCSDVLRTGQYKEESIGIGDGYYASFYQPGHWQNVSLSLSYTFGTQQWHKRRNVGNSDEESRLGGSSKGK